MFWAVAAVSVAALSAQSPATSPAAIENAAASPLTPKGLDNIRALARLFGFVRYFYPSDEAAATDWNQFAVVAIHAVEPAQTSVELAAKLQNLFASIAPLIRVFPTGSTPPPIGLKPTRHIIMWQHHGLGLPQAFESPYTSKRVVLSASEIEPLEPFRAELPGGVSCLIPIVLYRSTSDPPAESVVPSEPGGSPNDRTTRLAAIIISWNVFQHFYPYFDIVRTDWMASLSTLLSEAAEDKDVYAFHRTLQRMTVALRDGHGSIGGPGGSPNFTPPVAWTWAGGQIVASSVNGDIGISVGDAVLTIDGRPATDVLNAREALIPGSTPQCIRERAVDQLMRGARGDKLRLELEPAIQPRVRKAVTVECTARAGDVRQPRPPNMKELEPGIFYVDLARLTANDFSALVPALAKARGIVFDMRDRPNQAVDLLQVFPHLLSQPIAGPPLEIPVVTRPDRQGMTFEGHQWQMTPVAPYFNAKRAFLTNGWDISYAETLLGMVEQYKLAEIVGEATAGTNGVVNPFAVPGGFEITWTGMRVLKHDRSPLFGVGIIPTIPVPLSQAGIAAGRDEVLEQAVKAVKK